MKSKCDSCDLDAMSCADKCPYGFRMLPVHPFGRYGFIYTDGKGTLYEVLKMPDKTITDCRQLCGYTDMKRPHLGCVLTKYLHLPVCRLYAVWKGWLPRRLRVHMHMVYFSAERPLWKEKLCAQFSTLQECTAT